MVLYTLESDLMTSAKETQIPLDATHQDEFFMYWGCLVKISTALNSLTAMEGCDHPLLTSFIGD
jgi:hypothetical protein